MQKRGLLTKMSESQQFFTKLWQLRLSVCADRWQSRDERAKGKGNAGAEGVRTRPGESEDGQGRQVKAAAGRRQNRLLQRSIAKHAGIGELLHSLENGGGMAKVFEMTRMVHIRA